MMDASLFCIALTFDEMQRHLTKCERCKESGVVCRRGKELAASIKERLWYLIDMGVIEEENRIAREAGWLQ